MTSLAELAEKILAEWYANPRPSPYVKPIREPGDDEDTQPDSPPGGED